MCNVVALSAPGAYIAYSLNIRLDNEDIDTQCNIVDF